MEINGRADDSFNHQGNGFRGLQQYFTVTGILHCICSYSTPSTTLFGRKDEKEGGSKGRDILFPYGERVTSCDINLPKIQSLSESSFVDSKNNNALVMSVSP